MLRDDLKPHLLTSMTHRGVSRFSASNKKNEVVTNIQRHLNLDGFQIGFLCEIIPLFFGIEQSNFPIRKKSHEIIVDFLLWKINS